MFRVGKREMITLLELNKRLRRNAVALSCCAVLLVLGLFSGTTFGWAKTPNRLAGEGGKDNGLSSLKVLDSMVGYDVFYYDQTEKKPVMETRTANQLEPLQMNQYDKVFEQNNDKTSIILRAQIQGYDADSLTLSLLSQTSSFQRDYKNGEYYDYISNICNVKVALMPGLTDQAEQQSDETVAEYIYEKATEYFSGQYDIDSSGNYVYVVEDDLELPVYQNGVARFVTLNTSGETVRNTVRVEDRSAISDGDILLVKSGIYALTTLDGAKIEKDEDRTAFNYKAGTYKDGDNSTEGTDVKNDYIQRSPWTFTGAGSSGFYMSATAITASSADSDSSTAKRYYLTETGGALSLDTKYTTVWHYDSGVLYTHHNSKYYALTCTDGTWSTTELDSLAGAPKIALQAVTLENPVTVKVSENTTLYHKEPAVTINVSHFGEGDMDSGNRMFIYVQLDYDLTLVNAYLENSKSQNMQQFALDDNTGTYTFNEKFRFILNSNN